VVDARERGEGFLRQLRPALLAQPVADTSERVEEAILVHGLEHVVERVVLERGNRILIECSDQYDRAGERRLDAVEDRILHQRQEDERGRERVHRFRVAIDDDAEAVTESDLLDGRELRQHLELTSERPVASRAVRECRAQEVTQTRDHLLRRGWFIGDQRRHRVESIEEEVRMDLGLERRELSRCDCRLELGRTELACACHDRVPYGKQNSEEEPIREDDPEEPSTCKIRIRLEKHAIGLRMIANSASTPSVAARAVTVNMFTGLMYTAVGVTST
jgi:hypothetical protein